MNKQTRLNVPKLSSHLVSNHDLLWTWQEEHHIPPEERFGFWARLVRFLILQLILLGSIAFLIGNRGEYFYEECQRRNQCMTNCNEDYFPNLVCAPVSYSLVYAGNEYNSLFYYPQTESSGFSECKNYLSGNPDYEESEWDSSRNERLNTCFNACRTSDSLFSEDGRPECTGSNQNDLVCVDPESDCEEVYLPLESGDRDTFSFDVIYLFVGMIIANVLQYLYQFLIILTVKTKLTSLENVRMGTAKCGLQLSVLLVSTAIAILVIWQVALVQEYGPGTALWGTFLLAFVVDQAKSFLFHLAVWYFLLKKCGYLKTNEEEFTEAEWKNTHKDTAFKNFRAGCTKVLETNAYERISITLLIIYGVFVLIALSIAEELPEDDRTLDIIDQVFLSVFLVEIICQTFVKSISYYKDFFNSFDAIVVVVSFALFFVEGVGSRGLAALRLLRLARLVIVLRKVSASAKRKNNEFSSPLEESLHLLRNLRQNKKLSMKQKKDLHWVVETIESYKLYDVTLSQNSDKNQQNAQDIEARKWINLTTMNANDPLQWFDRDLDDYLYERQRDGEPGQENEMYAEELKQVVELPEKVFFQLEKMFDDIGSWRFNAFQYTELCGSQSISHFLIRLFQFYDISRKFEIPTVSLKNLTEAIYEGYSSSNPYHNATHAIDVTHRVNYFILSGNLMKYISDLDIMAALLASAVHDFQHPGVNNDFLIARSHPKAVRYNDISVLEKHHLAAAFSIILDQNCDITINLTEDQFWVVRSTIIKMVLATDLKLQEEVVSSFRNHKGITNFPNDDYEKHILMSFCMRISDYGNPLQPSDLYFKWMGLMMEEMYQQGDMEEHLGMDFSAPFMNRAEANPYATQLAFCEVVLEPMANIWVEFIPEIREDIIEDGLNKNMRLLKEKADSVASNEEDFQENSERKNLALSEMPRK